MVFFLFLLFYIGHPFILPKSQAVTTRGPSDISAEQKKRRLLDVELVQAPWLKQYPMIEQEVNHIIDWYKKNIERYAKELFQEFPDSFLLPYELRMEEIRQFEPDIQDIISVRMIIYTYTGGAHGNRSYYRWNWSKSRKQFLSLEEIITSGQLTPLINHTRDILFEQQKKGDKYDECRRASIQKGISEKEDFEIWNLDRDGIVFVFPEYQVASYAEGSFEVYIPQNLLQ